MSTSQPAPQKMPRFQLLAWMAVVLAIWVPRTLALDRFATTDEPLWLMRAANFYCALGQRDFARTFQREHPGVTTMWAGVAGFLWRWPGYRSDCPYILDRDEHEPVLRAHGVEPLRLLAAGRFVLVLGNTAALALGFAFARRLFGPLPALVGCLLIAFDPFHLAHSRLLHLDGLLSSLTLLALLAFLSYLHGRRFVDLLVSGMAAGLSWLTKSPALMLIPFSGLLLLAEAWKRLRARRGLNALESGGAGVLLLRGAIVPWVAWGAVGAATFVALWPAMWVDPIATLSGMLDLAGHYTAAGHGSPVFFDGTLAPDGNLGASFWYFYPLTYLWRSTPALLAGLVAAAVAFARKREPFVRPEARRAAAALALFAALLAGALTWSAKKFDRYLLPAYLPLDLVAATGWVAFARWLAQGWFASRQRRPFPRAWGCLAAVLGAAIAVQATVALRTFPYYLSYYNPLMGGAGRAAQVMMIGWGEGLDQAARTLNEKPDVQQLRVYSWYNNGSFSYFFRGESGRIPSQPQKWTEMTVQTLLNADYVVLYYLHQLQRQAPGPLLSALAPKAPEHSVWIDGLEYVRIYRLSGKLDADPAYVRVDATLGEHVLLEGYTLPASEFAPGDIVPIWLSWRAREAPGERLKVFLHVLDEGGVLAAQSDAEPAAWSRPTDGWQPGEQIADAHGISLPSDLAPGTYTLVVGMYRSSGERLIVTQAGGPVGDALTLGQITVRAR